MSLYLIPQEDIARLERLRHAARVAHSCEFDLHFHMGDFGQADGVRAMQESGVTAARAGGSNVTLQAIDYPDKRGFTFRPDMLPTAKPAMQTTLTESLRLKLGLHEIDQMLATGQRTADGVLIHASLVKPLHSHIRQLATSCERMLPAVEILGRPEVGKALGGSSHATSRGVNQFVPIFDIRAGHDPQLLREAAQAGKQFGAGITPYTGPQARPIRERGVYAQVSEAERGFFSMGKRNSEVAINLPAKEVESIVREALPNARITLNHGGKASTLLVHGQPAEQVRERINGVIDRRTFALSTAAPTLPPRFMAYHERAPQHPPALPIAKPTAPPPEAKPAEAMPRTTAEAPAAKPQAQEKPPAAPKPEKPNPATTATTAEVAATPAKPTPEKPAAPNPGRPRHSASAYSRPAEAAKKPGFLEDALRFTREDGHIRWGKVGAVTVGTSLAAGSFYLLTRQNPPQQPQAPAPSAQR